MRIPELVLPIGHEGGAWPDGTGRVRVGTRLVTLEESAFTVWRIAHDAGNVERTVAAAQRAGIAKPGHALAQLRSWGVLMTLAYGPGWDSELLDFLRGHRAHSLLTGLGSVDEQSDDLRVGLPGTDHVVVLDEGAAEVWQWSAVAPSLWHLALARSRTLTEMGDEDGACTSQESVLANVMTLVEKAAAYLDVIEPGPECGAGVEAGGVSPAGDADPETRHREAAAAGDVVAMRELGDLLSESGDTRGALAWYGRAAATGDAQALHWMGGSRALAGDMNEAEAWFRRAGDAGWSASQLNVGLLLTRRGELEEAETWLRRAAVAGHAPAMSSLGAVLQRQDRPEDAEAWFRRAAEAGNTDGMFNLSSALRRLGRSGEAESWLQRAADAGHPSAMNTLGVHLGARDASTAEVWLRRAVHAGDPHAEANLARLLRRQGQ